MKPVLHDNETLDRLNAPFKSGYVRVEVVLPGRDTFYMEMEMPPEFLSQLAESNYDSMPQLVESQLRVDWEEYVRGGFRQ